MDRDPLVRLLLFVILATLVALVVKVGGGGGSVVGGGERFALDATHAGSPVMFRLNTHTGETWKFELRGGNDRWKPILEPDEDSDPAAPPGLHHGTARIPAPPPERTPQPALERPEGAPAPIRGREGPEWDVPLLARALQDTSLPRDLRVWSAGRLALQDVPQSTAALLAVQRDEEPLIVAAALAALAGRSDSRIAPAIEAARSHADPVVQAAAQALLE